MDLVVLTPGGGLLNADELHAEVVVGAGASLRLRTQAATQVHRGRSAQSWRITVGEQASLGFLPRALVPHAYAVHHVATSVAIASSASAFFSEVIAPGRAHQGESFLYEELRSDLDVWRDGKLVARERQLVRPSDGLLAMQLGGYSHFGSAYVLDSKSGAVDIDEGGPKDDLVVSSSDLASGGRCVRALGYRAFDLELAFEHIAAGLLNSDKVAPACDDTSHTRSVAVWAAPKRHPRMACTSSPCAPCHMAGA